MIKCIKWVSLITSVSCIQFLGPKNKQSHWNSTYRTFNRYETCFGGQRTVFFSRKLLTLRSSVQEFTADLSKKKCHEKKNCQFLSEETGSF